jgi:hypothetical protein
MRELSVLLSQKNLAEKLKIEQTGSEVVHLASFGDTSQRVRHMRKVQYILSMKKYALMFGFFQR